MTSRLNPYLGFRDNAREAMEFYHSVFGGELTSSTFAEMHGSEDPAEGDKIMHSQLESPPAGYTLMGADTPNSMELPADQQPLGVAERRRTTAELRGYWDGLADGGDDRDAAREGALGRLLRDVRRQVRRPAGW